jgi:prepilin-type N-terminal cleavage/methylation domain-containing protein
VVNATDSKHKEELAMNIKLGTDFRKNMNTDSFTLLELIIVLAVLAILASVAVAKFTDLHCKSIGIVEQATMEAFRTAVLLYKARYDVWPFWNNDNDPNTPGPFDLLDNPPPNWNREENNNSPWGADTHWTWYAWPPNKISIYCPHKRTADYQFGIRWEYLSASDMIGTCGWPFTKYYSAGSVTRCPQLNLPPLSQIHCQ